MRLVYKATGKPVELGDIVKIDGADHTVTYFCEPHSPASSGKVNVDPPISNGSPTIYVSGIGAEWIEREDRE